MLGRSRRARFVRRFAHGAGDTSLAQIDGRTVVVKAWAPGSPMTRPKLDAAFGRMAAVRDRGVPIPEVLEHGEIEGHLYAVYGYVSGRWPSRVTGSLLDELIAVVDAERGAAPVPAAGWGRSLHSILAEGDRLLDVTPAALEHHAAGAGLLYEARRRLDHCGQFLDVLDDVVHRDFAPENVLVSGGKLCAVVDWEQSSAGDSRFDLVGLLFDIEIGRKAAPSVNRKLREALAERLPPALLGAYVAFYAVRYASWAVGTSMENEVLELAQRLTFGYDDGSS